MMQSFGEKISSKIMTEKDVIACLLDLIDLRLCLNRSRGKEKKRAEE